MPGWGLLLWLVLSVAFTALDLAGVAEGLALTVPLIVAAVAAHAVGRASWGRNHLTGVALAVAAVCAAGAAATWALALEPFGLDPFETVVASLAAAALAAVLAPARLRAAWLRPLGLDPACPVHAVAAATMVLTALSAAVLFVQLQEEPSASVPFHPTEPLVAVVSDVALALAGVGFLVTRDVAVTLARLDLRPLRPPQVGYAALTALALNVAVAVMEWAESLVLPGVHALEDRFEFELVGIPPVAGAALVSLSAGVGEEVLFRGALQPRVGIAVSAALFAVLHVQYQIPGILMIFAVGAALGLVKRRTSTTFTIVVHVVYDLVAFLAHAWT
ncbi:MAG TPA: type II CAAX endopeptidase family protein [Methylomirabilota bacterium]|nr:type II CAAX endopeptidase family protein [Methylomirabilota bacterium]